MKLDKKTRCLILKNAGDNLLKDMKNYLDKIIEQKNKAKQSKDIKGYLYYEKEQKKFMVEYNKVLTSTKKIDAEFLEIFEKKGG